MLFRSVEQLVREGLVRRERGRGTFVADLAESASARNGFQFSHARDREADDVSIRVARTSSVAASDTMQQLLRSGNTTPIHEVVRIHESRQKPYAVEVLHLPSSVIPNIDALDLTAGRVHPLIEQLFGLRLTHAEETLRAVTVNGEAGELLNLAGGSAAFRIERRSWAGTSLFEISTITIPGDRKSTRLNSSH